MSKRNKRQNRRMEGRNNITMLSDSLKSPDYSTPHKRKRFVESQCQMVQNAVIKETGDETRGYLQPPFGERRQKAILAYLDRAEAEFGDFGLRSVVESFTRNELNPFDNYNHIDADADLRIGAALWILDKLRASGKLHEAYRVLPDTSGDVDAMYLPMDFHHVCYDNDLIQSVIQAITTRYPEYSWNSVITFENARGKRPSEAWRKLLALLPEDEVNAACSVFRDKVWELAARNMKGQAYYDKAITQLIRSMQNIKINGAFAGSMVSPADSMVSPAPRVIRDWTLRRRN